MSVVVNTNVDSIKIQNLLNASTNSLSTAMERLSSGLKVNSAKDDAAGTVIAARMTVQMNGNQTAQNNVQNGDALLQTMEGYLDTIEDNVSRIRDLTLQAKNGTYSTEEIQAMQDEVAERIEEINRISEVATYSQLSLFEDTDGLQTDGITFQVGANYGEENTISVAADLFASVKFSTMSGLSSFDLTTSTDLDSDLEALDDALDNITSRKSLIGSAQNRLESALETLETQYENLSSAKSIIMDSDVASEASSYTQSSILQQIATSLLAVANQAPSVALSLI